MSLADGSETQKAKPEAAVKSAGIPTNEACPKSAKICRGVKGLATHQRRCKVPIDVDQLLGAHAPAEDNPAAASMEQAPDEVIVPTFVVPAPKPSLMPTPWIKANTSAKQRLPRGG